MDHFAGKVVLITGASEGLGQATALRLAGAGAHVVACARREEPLERLTQDITAAGGSVKAQRLDVADLGAYAALIADTHKRWGRLDGLVNNAASVTNKRLVDLDITEWRRDFAVNMEAVFVGTREAMRIMITQGQGSIVNVASTCGVRAMPSMSSYSASKAGLIHFSACAAMEGGPHGVRVNVITPGWIDTPSTRAWMPTDPKALQALYKDVPLHRPAQADEVARAIQFLLSDASSYITGVAIPVDGGSAIKG
jgi:meso-butanediol dehydrogenase/(S,S)-butanediol dehydrogenase/diacetyl reductase